MPVSAVYCIPQSRPVSCSSLPYYSLVNLFTSFVMFTSCKTAHKEKIPEFRIAYFTDPAFPGLQYGRRDSGIATLSGIFEIGKNHPSAQST